jgi:acyl-CoA synthetase (AMP-forming)/AMP-acid ligase II
MVFAGYWRDPDATTYTLRDAWHHTGDMGTLDSDGYLYYVGRLPEKELVKSGGENIYPAEVEHVLQNLPEIEAVCVIGVPDSEWGESVKAVVEFAPGESLTEEEIRTSVSERIASFKKPRFVEIVEALPRQENGEIDRVAVKEQFG